MHIQVYSTPMLCFELMENLITYLIFCMNLNFWFIYKCFFHCSVDVVREQERRARLQLLDEIREPSPQPIFGEPVKVNLNLIYIYLNFQMSF